MVGPAPLIFAGQLHDEPQVCEDEELCCVYIVVLNIALGQLLLLLSGERLNVIEP